MRFLPQTASRPGAATAAILELCVHGGEMRRGTSPSLTNAQTHSVTGTLGHARAGPAHAAPRDERETAQLHAAHRAALRPPRCWPRRPREGPFPTRGRER